MENIFSVNNYNLSWTLFEVNEKSAAYQNVTESYLGGK